MKKKVVKDWKCMECGKLMTFKQAEKAAFNEGCPKCGGSDVDLADVPLFIVSVCLHQLESVQSDLSSIATETQARKAQKMTQPTILVSAPFTYGGQTYEAKVWNKGPQAEVDTYKTLEGWASEFVRYVQSKSPAPGTLDAFALAALAAAKLLESPDYELQWSDDDGNCKVVETQEYKTSYLFVGGTVVRECEGYTSLVAATDLVWEAE